MLFELTESATTKHPLTIVLKITGTNDKIYVTKIYAPHKVAERIDMFNSLSQTLNPFYHPYKIIAENLNMVVNLGEKKGGLLKLEKDSEAF